jgi:apolipoprotein N-acyltransferase
MKYTLNKRASNAHNDDDAYNPYVLDSYGSDTDNDPNELAKPTVLAEFLASSMVRLMAVSLAGLLFGTVFHTTGVLLGTLKLTCLALLFLTLRNTHNWRTSFILGWAFGATATFSGMSWLYTAMHDIGGLDIWLAVLAMMLFSLLLGAFTAVSTALFTVVKNRTHRFTFNFVACWVLGEWLRTWVITGMPWMTTGYGFLETPLTGVASSFGVLGVSAVAILLAVCLVRLVFGEPFESFISTFHAYKNPSFAGKARHQKIPAYFKNLKRFALDKVLLIAGLTLAMCYILGFQSYTTPYGQAITVSLLQGNIPQNLKFDERQSRNNLEVYAELVSRSTGQLVVLPETALPLWQNIPSDIVDRLKAAPGTLVVGSLGMQGKRYTNRLETPFVLNTINSPNASTTASARKASIAVPKPWFYDKSHLVPFGESIPWGFDFFVAMMKIPMSSLAAGSTQTPNLQVAGLNIAPNICYEEIFAHEWRHRAAKANILLNASNFGWYGNSAIFEQHMNIARMRVLEFQKPYLSATNNGTTLIVKPDGSINALKPNRGSVLEDSVQGMVGVSPYSVWGDWALVALALGLLLWSVIKHKR